MREKKSLEIKEDISATFLKTVSAYANYGEGVIMFGIADDGTVTGMKDPLDACLRIENMINDNIDPHPDFTIEIDEKTKVVKLKVEEGDNKPYLYKGKAYKRNDSSTIAVDRFEFGRLVLSGSNISYDSTPSKFKELTFNYLAEKLKTILNVEDINLDVMKTLALYSDKNGYSIAGELFADKNSFKGIDIAKFGEDINIINERIDLSNSSILKQFDEAVSIYKRYYQYEMIDSAYRKKVEQIPEEAFREAIANALVHRDWDIASSIKISMFSDRIEIISPGTLPSQVKEKDYLSGNVSYLKNPIIGNIFFRLHIIENFGTGITRIKKSYENSIKEPIFEISENNVKIILPVISDRKEMHDEEKRKIIALLKNKTLSSTEIATLSTIGKTKTVAILNELLEDGCIIKLGNGRSTKYTSKN